MKIQVLLSTYNGEKYLREQLDSILTQEDVEVELIIRDDGSADSTLDILQQYEGPNVSVLRGTNVGATGSFFELLKSAGDADFYAFSDQDDVWDKDKLNVAVTALAQYNNRPAIYSSNAKIVDEHLNIIIEENKKPATTLGSALIKNYATGCTVVFNNTLLQLLKKSFRNDAPYHDWWVNLVALSVGGVSLFDDTPHINYRQHGNNVVGGSTSFFSKWGGRLKKLKKSPYKRNLMAAQILELYDEYIGEKEREILTAFSKYPNEKKQLLFCKKITTNKKIDDFLFRLCVLMNRI